MKLLVFVVLFVVTSNAKKAFSDDIIKNDGDFEFVRGFVNENDRSVQEPTSVLERKKWIHDPSNDLCKPLNCKKKELCLLEDAFTAVCVSKKELHKNKDEVLTRNKFLEDEAKRKAENSEEQEAQTPSYEDSQQDDDIFYDSHIELKENNCKPCPSASHPKFICGTDNKTYSSLCRLNYHNCLQASQIKVSCKGFCPCDSVDDTLKNPRKGSLEENYGKAKENNIRKKLEKSKVIKVANSKYAFTPEDIQYDNKHYKYIKFTASESKMENSLPKKMKDEQRMMKAYSTKSVECKPQQLTAIGNRLLDWFSVIMGENKKKRQHVQKPKARFPSLCKAEAKWMFGHLDTSLDGELSLKELYDLEHDQNEKCIRPFIDNCDQDRDHVLNPREWCRCFEKTDRPCAAVLRRLKGDPVGSYAPDCDDNGFYRPTQCHKSVGICWCVDKHGVEFANTRTRDKPHCEDVLNYAAPTVVMSDDEDDIGDDGDNGDGDDSTEEEGSAYSVLVF